MSELETKIKEIQEKQGKTVVKAFSYEDGMALGNQLYQKAKEGKLPIVISITMNQHQIYYGALEGTAQTNDDWIRRKQNTVYKFGKSSYEMALSMQLKGGDFATKYGVDSKDFVAAGGCVPILVEGVGMVGTLGVSGMKEYEDHDFVTDVLIEFATSKK